MYTFVQDKLQTPFNPVVMNLDDLDTITDEVVQLDSRNIDTDLLQMEGEEANKLYNDLKARATRRHQKEKRDQKMRDALVEEEPEQDDDDNGFEKIQHRERPSFSQDQIKNN